MDKKNLNMKSSFEWVIKDNLFHRAVADVRNRATSMINDPDAMAMIQDAAKYRQSAKPAAGAPIAGKAFGLPPSLTAVAGTAKSESTSTLPAIEELEKIVFFDGETGAMSFRMILRTLAREVNRAKQLERPITVFVLGLDQSEAITKQYGSQVIAETMKTLCLPALQAARCDIDVVGRYADTRLLFVLPEMTTNSALKLATMLMKRYPLQHSRCNFDVYTSIGVASYPDHGTEVEELIGMADFACDLAQSHGGRKIMLSPSSI